MLINVHKNFDVADVDMNFLTQQIESLEAVSSVLNDESVSAQLHVLRHDGVNHKDNIEIKVSIHIPKVSFQASVMCYKLTEGVEVLMAKLKRQVSKYKTRHHSRSRQVATLDFRDAFDFEEFQDQGDHAEVLTESDSDKITKHSLFSDMIPLSEEKALEQIKALGNEFLIFINSETDRYNIICKRKNHPGFAVIELESSNGILDL